MTYQTLDLILESETEKLLVQLRLLVLKRTTLKERLVVLQKLCNSTQQNNEWKNDLIEHENERLYEITELIDYGNYNETTIDELLDETKNFQNNSNFLREIRQKLKHIITEKENEILDEIKNKLNSKNCNLENYKTWIKTMNKRKWKNNAKAKEIYEEIQYNYIKETIKLNKDAGEIRKAKLEQVCNTLQKMSNAKALELLKEYQNELKQF
jgi:hypothetical protein